MRVLRAPYEEDAKQIAALTMPAKTRWLSSEQNKNRRQANKRLNNSHGIRTFNTLQGGMTSGLSSQSRPWFTLKIADEALDNDPEVRAWATEVERRMYAFMASTNFYGASKKGYREIGAFGTDACVAMEHPDEGLVFHALTFGEYWLGMNSALQAGSLYRDCGLTVRTAVEQFGNNVSSRIRTLYDTSQYEQAVQFFHAIEPNDDFTEGRLGWQGKPWRSVYWDEQDDRLSADEFGGLVQLGGFEEQPFWAPRWDTTGGDVWGNGPGHDALPDLRELQVQVKRKAEATDHMIFPELVSATKAKLRRQPKNVVHVDGLDAQKAVHAPHTIPYQAVSVIREDVNDLKMAIDAITYADLFMAITNMQGIQPRNIEEIAARNEEKLTQLGPVIEGINNEKLEIAIERVFGFMERKRLLPPAPRKLANTHIKVEFVSILTQMQRMVGLGQIERTVSFVGSVAAIYPSARYKLDPFKLIDEYADRAGAPADLIVPTEVATAQGEAEEQQQAGMAMAEMASKLGAPTKDMTDAAKVASDIPASGAPAVEDLVPLLPR